MSPRALLVATLGLLASPAAAGVGTSSCPERSSWPREDWPSRVEATRASRSREIVALEQVLFRLEGEDADRKGIRSDAVLIVQGGAVVYERYGRGWDASHRHLTWSVSKSLMDALTGVAVREGLLTLGGSVCGYVTDLPSATCPITVAHLLEMASGLDWKESYENESNRQSSVLAMLYGQGQADTGRFNASHALRDPPGTAWRYSSGDTCTLSKVLGRVMRPRYGPSFR